MAGISSPGIGSGLDVGSIVSQLVALERRPIELLAQQQSKLSAQLSSFGLMQSYMSNLQSAAAQLAKPEFWSAVSASSSDTASVGATASAGAPSGSYSVTVTQLAQAQSLASPAFSSAQAVVGTGTLRIQLGSWSADMGSFTAKSGTSAVDIEIGSGDQTLEGLRAKINAANAGVSASIVQDVQGARLVLTSTATGAQNGFQVTAPVDNGGLSALVANPPATSATPPPTGMLQTQAARNAQATVNGLSVESSSNLLDQAIQGVSLTLNKATASPVTIGVGTDQATLKKGVEAFVGAYNELSRFLSTQTRYDAGTKLAGSLQGDATALNLQGRLRSLVQQNTSASASFSTLSAIGLETQRDGTLKLNETRLAAALAAPQELAKAFSQIDAGNPANQGMALRFKSLADAAIGTDGLLTQRSSGLQAAVQRNEDAQARVETRVQAVQQRLLRQYGALDGQLGRLSSLSSYVSQQVANWNKSSE
ncbi:flagellar filament capping protein FliD [Ramlibacter sp. 2FC]|uniref:flagellar filament capping protein FliD n=1 Tax=Ramlibacter sp. 2FC TaxID=2502188 RepID=UPI0010F4DA7D|nr:flagellar filament capping protein FliD [Ramlibacter sp. 2FC]